MAIRISSYNHTLVKSMSENLSSVIDKLIRLAAKLTENWASDIVYDIEALNKAVSNGIADDRILFFRENGVHAMKTSDLSDNAYDVVLSNFTPIQIWRLTFDPNTMETKLMRISLRKTLL